MPYLSANRGLFTMPAVGIRFKRQMPSDLVIPNQNAVRRSHMIAHFAMFVLCKILSIGWTVIRRPPLGGETK